MAVIRQFPLPADTLPPEVAESYEILLLELSDWLSAPTPFQPFNVVDYFDAQLTDCLSPENRIRYLCRLTLHGGANGEAYPQATVHLQLAQALLPPGMLDDDPQHGLFSETRYLAWLAVRLTEAVCTLAGTSRLRGARVSLWAEWNATGQHYVRYQTDDLPTVQLLKYLFRVLVPFVQGSRTQSLSSLAEQIRHSVPRPAPGMRPPAPPPEPLPQTLQMLYQNGFTPLDVRELLAQFGAIDAQTGRWHLGELTGKAAKPKSAFPAVYRALADQGLLKKLEGPVWLKIFVAEFSVSISPRMANYDTTGPVSRAFHEFYLDAVRWSKVWQAKREADR